MDRALTTESCVELGAWVRAARKRAGLTLQELSLRAGTGMRFLSEFERGKDTAEIGKVISVFMALGTSLGPANSRPGAISPDDVPVRGNTVHAAASSPEGVELNTEAGPRPGAGDAGRLWDMLKAALEIRALFAPSQADSVAGFVRQRALERCFAVMGEAARRVTPATQARLDEIPWRDLVARRNHLVLEYDQPAHGELGQAAHTQLPGLIRALRAALAHHQ